MLSDAREDERRFVAAEWTASRSEHEDGAADRVDLAFGYIFAHLGDPDLRLAGTARHVGMSESAFSRYFTRITGVSFADTVRRLRLAQAGKLLRGTTLPVAAIAHRVGYGNLSNFNRQSAHLTATRPANTATSTGKYQWTTSADLVVRSPPT